MVAYFYKKLAPFLAPFFLLTTVVFFAIGFIRGEQVVSLQTKLLENKDKEIRVVVEQQAVSVKVSQAYEDRKTNTQQEKIYVDREVEKIIAVPSYGNLCFDDRGLQFFNEQITSLNSARKLTNSLPANTGAD